MNLTGISRRIEISFWTFAVRLMKEPKLLRIVLISSALVFSLLFGWFVFSTIKHVQANQLAKVSETVPVSVKAPEFQTEPISSGAAINQRKVLILVLDNLQVTSPQVESIWLATYVKARSQVVLLPIFPTLQSIDLQDEEKALGDFRVNEDGVISQDFIDWIQMKQIDWDNYIFLDEFGLAMLIDNVGGIDLGRGQVSGVRALSQIPLARDDSQAALFGYATLARTICRNSVELVDSVEVLDLYQQFGSHIRTDLPEQLLVDEWQRLRNAKTGISCEFPNLQKSSVLP